MLTSVLAGDADVNVFDRVIDAGNVVAPAGDIHGAFGAIEQALSVALGADCTPLTLGGDGAVSLPQCGLFKECTVLWQLYTLMLTSIHLG